MNRTYCLLALLALLATFSATNAQSVLVYDAVSDISSLTTTGTVPHTYTGQAFNITNSGGATPQITGMKLGTFVIGAQNDAFSQLRIQFWGTFDPSITSSSTSQVFSNPVGSPIIVNTGAISTTGNAATIWTITFGTPITLPGTTNLGIAVNWQSSTDGITFNDDTNLVGAFRSPVGTNVIPIGTNITTGTNVYYRNASNLTNFDFQGNDSRVLAGQTQATDGLAFQLTAVAVPEPATWVLIGMGGVAAAGAYRRWRRRNTLDLNQNLSNARATLLGK